MYQLIFRQLKKQLRYLDRAARERGWVGMMLQVVNGNAVKARKVGMETEHNQNGEQREGQTIGQQTRLSDSIYDIPVNSQPASAHRSK
jgi:hypothetical protein